LLQNDACSINNYKEIIMKCEYGCDKDATHQLKNGKWCCEANANSCIEVRRKNSEGMKTAYLEGRRLPVEYVTNTSWSGGKTAQTDPRVRARYITPEIVLMNDTTFTATVKRALKLVSEYKCYVCGNSGIWQDKKISLHIHHIDGNNRNNTKENLRYLCPNCHSQTANFGFKSRKHIKHKIISETEYINALKTNDNVRSALKSLNLLPSGKNYDRANMLIQKYNIIFVKSEPIAQKTLSRISKTKRNTYCECGCEISRTANKCRSCDAKTNSRRKVKDRPSKETLLIDVKDLGYCATGRKYGVSDNCIRKWMKSVDISS